MELQGTIKYISEPQKGTTKAGKDWQKVTFVLQYADGDYPKSIALDTFRGEIIDTLKLGEKVRVSFDSEAREYNGRLYNEVRAWRVAAIDAPTAPVNNSDLPFE